jgi:2-dehydro-3-deoxygluconokinase
MSITILRSFGRMEIYMELRKDSKYSLIVPTSMGVRITPINRQPVHTSKLFEMHTTSAETNVLNISASLGLPVKALTAFVKGSPIAEFIKSELRARNIEYEGMEITQDGPWGARHQFNIADSGFGPRGPRVHNDRAGEVGRMLDVSGFDLERIFKEEGSKILHISGLIAALSPETSNFCL